MKNLILKSIIIAATIICCFGFVKLEAQTSFNISNQITGDTLFTIDNQGNTGIGLTNPWARLDVQMFGTGAWQRGFRVLNPDMIADDGLLFVLGRSDDFRNMGYLNFKYSADQSESNRLSFGLYGVNDVLNVMGSGNIGISTISPDEKLTLAYDNFIGWEYSASNHSVAHKIGKSSDGAGPLEFITTFNPGATGQTFSFKNPIDRMTILYNGNVGIGTTTPQTKLEVADTIRSSFGGFQFPDGTVQETAASGYVTSETDPQVGATTAGLWCVGNGSQITAIASPPVMVEVDPKIETNVTNIVPKWNGTGLINGTIYDNGNIGIGTSNPISNLSVGGDGISSTTIYGENSQSNGSSVRGIAHGSAGHGVDGFSSGNTGTGVYGFASNSGDATNYGGYFRSDGEQGYGVYGMAINNGDVTNYGGYFRAQGLTGRGVAGYAPNSGDAANVGVHGTAAGTYGRGVEGYASNSGDVTNFGVYGTAVGTNGRGVYGYSTGSSGTGIYGSANGATGTGVYGSASNSGDVVNTGGHFRASGDAGRGVYAVAPGNSGRGIHAWASNSGDYINYGGYFQADGNSGRGVYGEATSFAGRGVYGYASDSGVAQNYGGYFEAAGNTGRAVYGIASNSGSSTNYGGYFEASGSTGRGVYGYASDTGGTNYGGYFQADGATSRGVNGISTGSNGIGIFGSCATGRGVYGGTGSGTGVYGFANSTNGVAVKGIASHATGKGVEGDGQAYDFDAVGPGVNYGSTSSKRWKTNIVEIDNPLVKINRLRGVYFDWDEDHGGGHDVGCIAEEVGKVLPEIVVYEENGIDADGMDYSKLTPLLIEAVKAQQKIIEKLEQRIDKLEKINF